MYNLLLKKKKEATKQNGSTATNHNRGIIFDEKKKCEKKIPKAKIR